MKKFKTIGLSLLVAACAVCLSLAFVACKGGEKSASYGSGEEGFYYYDGADSARYMLSLQSGTYMITANNETQYSGSYSYNDETREISFSGDTAFTATVGENALSLDMGDSGYSFKAYKYFDVTYVDENGVVIANESVLNGQSAEALSIEKDGYWFVGWFEDANNSSEFAFNTSIAGDTTVYGWYIEKNLTAAEYEITLDYGDGTTETVSTMNGAVWTLPADGILGWWVSATNNSGELTYKYKTGTAFTADTTLYAVYEGIGASVTGEGITWVSAGANVSVTVYNEDGTIAIAQSSTSSSNSSYAPSGFTSLSAGTYIVEVTSGTTTERLMYIVNGLSRVSKSSMEIVTYGDGRVLSFAPVENAFGYTITIDDGEKVVTEDLGSRTYYNLSSWEMTETGLNITITAYADGYVSSVSDEYNYLLKLDSVVIEMSGDDFSWNRVDGALEYEVIIYGEDDEILESFYTTDTSYSLKYYGAGMYTISVKPVTGGYWSTETFIHGQAKYTIAAPVITDITDYTISWTKIDEAESYVVMINGDEYAVTGGTTLAFSEYNVPETASSYEIAVMAIANEGLDSSYSDTVTATNKTFSSSVTYEKNTVTWNYDVSATSYVVSVNGVDTTIEAGNSAEITLNKAGNNEIVVTAYSGTTVLGQAEMDVYAYAVTLDPNGAVFEDGTSTSSTIYVAQGDTLKLGEVEKVHADFIGWYTQADYTDGQSDVYEGKGTEVANGSVFTGSRDMYLYAYWSYEYVEVTLVIGNGTLDDGTSGEMKMSVKYNSTSETLPVPTPNTAMEDFVGWFVDAGGNSTQYTNGMGVWNDNAFSGETTLYAFYLTIFSYDRTVYNGETVYSVSVSNRVNINRFTVVTIPEYYEIGDDGYSLILNSGAFSDCTTLVSINIPDTVKYIAVTSNGYASGSGAFEGCNSLQQINIYETGDGEDSTKEIMYYSRDGVLFHKTSDVAVELLYYPHGKTDASYVIPTTVSNSTECDEFGNSVAYDVTSLPGRVFYGKAFTEITISSTVESIETYAFYSNSGLTKVIFENGGNAELIIDDDAFYNCRGLTEITLPARYTEFNPNMFNGCTSLAEVHIDSGSTVYADEDGIVLSYDKSTLVYYPLGLGGEIDIASLFTTSQVQITAIGNSAFIGNTKITKVTVSGGVLSIGDYAFADCTGLTELVLSDSVTTIGKYAFSGCKKIKELTIPESVTMIDQYAFEDCSGITELTFDGDYNSNGLTIASYAFYGCTYIESVILPVNLTKLEANAFRDCTRLTYVYFDAKTGTQSTDLSFAANAFGSTNYIETLELGTNVPEIDFASVFDGGSLEEVIIASDNNNYMSDQYGVVYNKAGDTVMYYPLGRKGSYSVLEGTTTINANIFSDRVNLTEITIPASVTSIAVDATNGNCKAFSGSTYLTAINVAEGNSVYKSIDGVLYKYNEGGSTLTLLYCPIRCAVTSLTIDSSVNAVQCYAFQSNASVTDVSFAACGNFTLGTYAFYSATALTGVTFSETFTTISAHSFDGCSALLGNLSTGGTMTFPASLTTIGDYAFQNCKKFAIKIPANVSSIGDYAFSYCWDTSGTTASPITFESVGVGNAPDLTIGERAFYYSEYATGLTIPKNVVSMGARAFFRMGFSVASGTDVPLAFDDTSENCKVTEFSEGLFAYCRRTQNIVIPESVTKLNANSLASLASLTTITIPANVTELGYNTFLESTGIETVIFAEGSKLTTIGYAAFRQCTALKGIEIPATVTSIGYNAFYQCNKMEKFTYAAGSPITNIESNTFAFCSQLSDITLPSGITTIGDGAFQYCDSLQRIELPITIVSIGEEAFIGCNAITSFTFAEGTSALSSVGSNAFSGCESLTEFSFPETSASSITLGASIFGYYEEELEDDEGYITYPHHYAGIETLHLSGGITSLGSALNDCTSITGITVSATNTSYAADANGKILYDVGKSTIAYVFGQLETISIPSSVSIISNSAFRGQTLLKQVTIPATISSIGDYAFADCTALESVTFADNALCFENGTMGDYIFDGCTALTTATLPSGATKIPQYIFYGCTSLTELKNMDSVTEIAAYGLAYTGFETFDLSKVAKLGDCSFQGCENLATVTFGTSCPSMGSGIFRYCTAFNIETLPEGMTSLPGSLFSGCTSLTYFKVPSTVTSMGSMVFYNCTNLAGVDLPEGLTSMGTYAFYHCDSLVEIVLPSTCLSISQYAFNYAGITSISLPVGLTAIPSYCFLNARSLKTVIIPDTVETVNTQAFYCCYALESVVATGVTTIVSSGFRSCTSLTTVQFSPYLSSIGDYGFYGDTVLQGIEFTSYLTSIGASCFYNCSSLTSITIEKGTTTIGKNAFYGCTGLETVVISKTVSSVGDTAFQKCTCDIFVQNTKNYCDSNWGSWTSSFNGSAYFYTEDEPDFNASGTDYDGDYWYYDDDGEIVVWTFEYTTYAIDGGGYVLCSADANIISYVCLYDEDGGTSAVYAVTECSGGASGYTVTLGNGGTYRIVLSGETATVTAETA